MLPSTHDQSGAAPPRRKGRRGQHVSNGRAAAPPAPPAPPARRERVWSLGAQITRSGGAWRGRRPRCQPAIQGRPAVGSRARARDKGPGLSELWGMCTALFPRPDTTPPPTGGDRRAAAARTATPVYGIYARGAPHGRRPRPRMTQERHTSPDSWRGLAWRTVRARAVHAGARSTIMHHSGYTPRQPAPFEIRCLRPTIPRSPVLASVTL